MKIPVKNLAKDTTILLFILTALAYFFGYVEYYGTYRMIGVIRSLVPPADYQHYVIIGSRIMFSALVILYVIYYFAKHYFHWREEITDLRFKTLLATILCFLLLCFIITSLVVYTLRDSLSGMPDVKELKMKSSSDNHIYVGYKLVGEKDGFHILIKRQGEVSDIIKINNVEIDYLRLEK